MTIHEALVYILSKSSLEMYKEYKLGNSDFLKQEFFENYEFCKIFFNHLQSEKKIKIDCRNTAILTAVLFRDLNKEFVESYFGTNDQPRYYDECTLGIK